MVDDDRASLFSHTILYMYNHFGQIQLIIVTFNSGQAYICRPIYHAYFFWAAQTHPLFCEWTKSNPCYTSYHLMPSSIILAHYPNSPASSPFANKSNRMSYLILGQVWISHNIPLLLS
jgi:hypothetical protein